MDTAQTLRYVDNRLLTMPPVALMQVKKEIGHMISIVEENIALSFASMESGTLEYGERISKNEERIDYTNSALTSFLIKLSGNVDQSGDVIIGSYFHVLNDLERIGDHAENFHEIGMEMRGKKISFSETALCELGQMKDRVMQMLLISKKAFRNMDKTQLSSLTALENEVDSMKKELTANHFARLAEGDCRIEVSPYYSSVVLGLERVADHLVNVGYSIVNPTGSQTDTE